MEENDTLITTPEPTEELVATDSAATEVPSDVPLEATAEADAAVVPGEPTETDGGTNGDDALDYAYSPPEAPPPSGEPDVDNSSNAEANSSSTSSSTSSVNNNIHIDFGDGFQYPPLPSQNKPNQPDKPDRPDYPDTPDDTDGGGKSDGDGPRHAWDRGNPRNEHDRWDDTRFDKDGDNDHHDHVSKDYKDFLNAEGDAMEKLADIIDEAFVKTIKTDNPEHVKEVAEALGDTGVALYEVNDALHEAIEGNATRPELRELRQEFRELQQVERADIALVREYGGDVGGLRQDFAEINDHVSDFLYG